MSNVIHIRTRKTLTDAETAAMAANIRFRPLQTASRLSAQQAAESARFRATSASQQKS